MIAKLTGVVDGCGENSAVIDVGGVGYLVFCSGRTLAGLPASGRAVSLHIDTHVREDHIHLYGFGDTAERDWFRLLTTVQGVGARVALAILTALPANGLAQVIVAADKAALCQANGVGTAGGGCRWCGHRRDTSGCDLGPRQSRLPAGGSLRGRRLRRPPSRRRHAGGGVDPVGPQGSRSGRGSMSEARS